MQKSFLLKFGLLLISIVLGTLIGNGVLMFILWTQGLELSMGNGLGDIITSAEHPLIVLLGIGLNHFFVFTGAAAFYWMIIREGAFAKYFQLIPIFDAKLAGLLLLLLICSYPLIGASGLLSEYVEFPTWMQNLNDDYSSTMEGLFAGQGVAKLFLNLIVLAALPAMGEELIFRGIVQKELHRKLTNPHAAILLTSVIFSAIHLQAEGFMPKLLISLILCYTYYWTKSLWYPILLHFFNNAFMTIALYMGKDELEKAALQETPEFPWVGVIFSLFLCALVIWSILDHLSHQKTNSSTAEQV